MGITFRSLGVPGRESHPRFGGGDHAPERGTFDDGDGPAALLLKPAPRDWTAFLQRAIETEILPHIMATKCADHLGFMPVRNVAHPSEADIAAFVGLIIADDMEQARAVADRMIVLSGGRDALLRELLTPAAQFLGAMWEHDICDFTTVTLGVYRLDQIMKETAAIGADDYIPAVHDRTILLLPAPGEQHSFGLNMVADIFREGGWCVRSGSGVARAKLMALVQAEWFDLIGLSVTSERALKGLPACIRAIREASCNPHLGVFIGGRAMIDHVERTRFLGADVVSNDAHQALRAANIFVEATVTERLHQSKTKLVDIG